MNKSVPTPEPKFGINVGDVWYLGGNKSYPFEVEDFSEGQVMLSDDEETVYYAEKEFREAFSR